MTLDDLLLAVARFALGASPTDDEALTLVILLHTHRLNVTEAVSDRPGVDQVFALTQRHACEVVAAAWPDARKRATANSTDLYWRFNMETPFETVEDVKPPWDARLARTREKVLQSGLVREAVPED